MTRRIFIISSVILLLWGISLGYAQEGDAAQKKKIDELIGTLGTRYWEKAADELVQLGEAVVVPLIETVNIGSGRPSENAVLVLARIGTPEAVETVLRALKNRKFHLRIRAYAAMALGDTGSEDFVDDLIESLQTDKDWWVRNFAVGSLGKIGTERVIDPVIEAMNDENQYVRRAAISVLGEMKPKKAVLPLVRAMTDDDWQIRLRVPDVLMGFGGKIEGSLLEALKIDNKWAKVGAVSVLGRLKSENAVFRLISLLEDKERMVRDEAAVGLSRINSPKAVKPLLELMKHEASYVREEAAWVLGEMRSRDAVQSLIEALDDGDFGWMAAVSLGKIGDKQAVEPLRKKAANQDSRVGQAADWALSRMKVETRNDARK